MKIFYTKLSRLIRTFVLNISFIFIFAIIYLHISNDFVLTNGKNQEINFIDCLLTSTSIQAGVGITNIMPLTNLSKLMMIIHQICMITIHLLSFIFFIFL